MINFAKMNVMNLHRKKLPTQISRNLVFIMFFFIFSSIHLQCSRNTFVQGSRIPLLGIFSQLGKIQKTKHAFVKFLTTFLKKVEIRKVIYFRKKRTKKMKENLNYYTCRISIQGGKNRRIKTQTKYIREYISRNVFTLYN